MLMTLLAQAGPDIPAPTMVDGNWVTTFVVGVIIAVGGIWLRKTGVAAGKAMQGDVTISGQPIAVRKEEKLPTWAEVSALSQRVSRLEDHLELIRSEQTAQFKELLEAGHQRELRLRDTLSQAIGSLGAKLSNDVRMVHERIEGVQNQCNKDLRTVHERLDACQLTNHKKSA